MRKNFGLIIVLIVFFLIVLKACFYTVDETQTAILLRFGKVTEGLKEPGIHFKIPGVHQAVFFERRLLDYDAKAAEILTEDKKTLVVDNYAKWRIINPLEFFTAVQTANEALSRLDDIIFAELRVELGRHKMGEIISENRAQIMANVTKRSDAQARPFGIQILDVRIKRADLPQQNERAVFGRMQAEREREAKLYRAEGKEQQQKIEADADRQKTIILAEAYKRSQQLRGEGDATATAIYAQAFTQDPEFFSFIRTLESYGKALDDKTVLVLTEKDEFLQYLNQSGANMEKPLQDRPIVFPKPLPVRDKSMDGVPPAPVSVEMPEPPALTGPDAENQPAAPAPQEPTGN